MTKKRAEQLGDNRYGITYRPSVGKEKGYAMAWSVGTTEEIAAKKEQDLIEAGKSSWEIIDILIEERRKVLGTLEEARETARQKSLEENVRTATVFDASSWSHAPVEHWKKGERIGTITAITERLRKKLGL